MFTNMKSTFGTTTPGTSFGLGASTSTTSNPWSNSNNTQMFNKPGNSGFGQQAPVFGQPSTSSNSFSPFFPQNNAAGFGTASTANQTTFGSNVFGQQQPQQPANNTLFGSNSFSQPKTGFGFGTQNQQQPNLFGQTAQPQNLLFQPSGSTTLFGNTNAFNSGTVGTTVKFCPVSGTDTMQKNNAAISINTKHHCITCMKEYEGKSLEELRFEDYQANRKGPQSQFGSTPFGNSPSMFGQTTENKPAFGQPSVSFNQMSGTTFGQPSQTFGMGNQQSTANNLFGKPTAFGTTGSTSAGFGTFNTASSGTNSFGSNQNKPFGATAPLFGNTQAQQQTSSFGNNLFGQNNQTTNSSFFNKPAQTAGFGTSGFTFNQTPATTASSLFQPPKPVFGLGQPTSAGGFGQTTSFGSTNPPTAFGASTFGKQLTFGQNTSSFQMGTQNNLFSNTQQKPGSLLGGTGGGLFGANNFGNTTSSFGVSQPNIQQNAQGFSLDVIQESKNLNLPMGNQFGHSPFLTGLLPVDKSLSPTLCTTNPAEIKKMLENNKKVDEKKVNKKVNLKLRPPKTQRDNIFEEANDEEINKLYKMSCKRLTLKNNDDEPKKSIFEVQSIHDELSDTNVENTVSSVNGISKRSNISFTEQETSSIGKNAETSEVINVNKQFARHNLEELISQEYAAMSKEISPSSPKSTEVLMFKEKAIFNNYTETPKTGLNKSTEKEDVRNDSYKSSVSIEETLRTKRNNNEQSSSQSVTEIIESEDGDTFARKTPKCGIILNRSEYYTLPPIEELDKMIGEDGRCMVRGFTVGRRKYGNAYFPDELNVKNLNLDEIVHFRYKEINMYPDESKKPPVGEGLNRRAQVTLDRVYPRVKDTKEIIEDVEQILATKFPEQLVEISAKHGLKFIDYRPETGSWVFMVEHFSKYGFTESDEEDCELSTTNPKAETKQNSIGKLLPGKQIPAAIIDEDIVNSNYFDGMVPKVNFDNSKYLFEQRNIANRKNENRNLGVEAVTHELYIKSIQDNSTEADMFARKERCLENLETYLSSRNNFQVDKPGDIYDRMFSPSGPMTSANSSRRILSSDQTLVVTQMYPGSNITVSKQVIPDKCFSRTDEIIHEKQMSNPPNTMNPMTVLNPKYAVISSEDNDNNDSILDNILSEKQPNFDHRIPARNINTIYTIQHNQRMGIMDPNEPSNSHYNFNSGEHRKPIDFIAPHSKYLELERIKISDSDKASNYTDEEDLGQCDLLKKSMEVDLDETFTAVRPTNENLFYHDTQIQTMKAAFFADSGKIPSPSLLENFEVKTGKSRSPDEILNEYDEESALSEYEIAKTFTVLDAPEPENRCYTDLSVFSGRIGRVAWLQGYKHYCIEAQEDNFQYNLILGTLSDQNIRDHFKETIVQCIRLAQEHSKTVFHTEKDLPTLHISDGRSYLDACFKAFLDAPRSNYDSEVLYKDVWSLCHALWGFDENHAPFLKRRLSSWLRVSLNEQISPKTNTTGNIDECLHNIYQNLSCFNVEEAAEMAMDIDMPVLSLIMAQVNLAQKPKELIKKQLTDWFTCNYADHMSSTLLKIYSLLSGQPFHSGINVCEDLDWKRAFGLHLWYLTDEGSPLGAAIDAYTCGFEQEGYAAMPTPLYHKEKKSDVHDIRYELLLLFRNGNYHLSKVLNPKTYTHSNTDYRLSWLLLLLFRSMNVGFIDISEENIIHTSFSTQLEDSGVWVFAIVPLLFLKDSGLKKKLVYNLLYRNFPIDCDEEEAKDLEAKLTGDFHIPYSWIEEIREKKRIHSQICLTAQ